MNRIIIDNAIPAHFHFAIKLTGWWFEIDEWNLARVYRVGNSFYATVYDVPSKAWMDRHFKMDSAGRAVLGIYRTIQAAREVAVARVQCEKLPKVCTWADVVEARRLMKQPRVRDAAGNEYVVEVPAKETR